MTVSLGMPETPDKYEIAVSKGATADENFQKWARGTFHELGLNVQQGKALTEAFNKFTAEQAGRITTDYETRVATDKQGLMAEWRGGYESQMAKAQGAANALGFTGEVIDAMEQAMGYGATMKFFAGLAAKMSEDVLVTGGDGNKRTTFENTLTPDQAKAQWESKKLDASFMAALRDKSHPGHAEAQRQQTALFGVMYPNGQANG